MSDLLLPGSSTSECAKPPSACYIHLARDVACVTSAQRQGPAAGPRRSQAPAHLHQGPPLLVHAPAAGQVAAAANWRPSPRPRGEPDATRTPLTP